MPLRRAHFVYFVAPIGGGPVRIGCSALPEARLSTLSVYSPVELEILATLAGGTFLEAWLHEYFAADRLRGEWIRPSSILLEIIETAQRGVRHRILPAVDPIATDAASLRAAVLYAQLEVFKLSVRDFFEAIGFNLRVFPTNISARMLAKTVLAARARGLRFAIEDANRVISMLREAA